MIDPFFLLAGSVAIPLILMLFIAAQIYARTGNVKQVLISSGVLVGFTAGYFGAPLATPAAVGQDRLVTSVIIGVVFTGVFLAICWRRAGKP